MLVSLMIIAVIIRAGNFSPLNGIFCGGYLINMT